VSPALHEERQQRARGARPHDANHTSIQAHRRSACDSASTAANTSWYEL
jgi:hypothetical protein